MLKQSFFHAAFVTACVVSCSDGPSQPESLPPASFRVTADSQIRFPGTALPYNPSIQLVDSYGSDATDGTVQVTWTVVEGGGTVNNTVVTTSSIGRASNLWVLGPDDGVNRLRVEVGTFGSYVFTAKAVQPGPILFVSNRRTGIAPEPTGAAADAFVMNTDGTDVVQVSPRTGFRGRVDWIDAPAWSPNGDWIAYVRYNYDPGITLFVIKADGTGERPVEHWWGRFLDPTWSPTGSDLVAANQYYPPGYPDWDGIYEVAAFRPSEPRRVSQRPCSDPAFSPDGNPVVYACGPPGNSKICTISEDGTDLVELTSGPADQDPAWSPDGSRILFARDTTNAGGIWAMNADGSAQEKLLDARAFSPHWSPSGTEFVVAIADGAGSDIWRVTLSTGERIKLTHGEGNNWDPDWRR